MELAGAHGAEARNIHDRARGGRGAWRLRVFSAFSAHGCVAALWVACASQPAPRVQCAADESRGSLGPPVTEESLRAAQWDCARRCPCRCAAGEAPAGMPAATPGGASSSAPASAQSATLDPDEPMPEHSVTTDATLQLEVPADAMLDARSDVFSSAMAAAARSRGGVLPAAITLVPGGGFVTFSGVHGRIGCWHGSHYGADGGDCAGGHTRLTAADAVSGIVANERTLFVTGVFLGDAPNAKAPAGLDFSNKALGTSFDKLDPQLGQSFFIGDGLTGTADGKPQRFVIPAGATKLYLGFADGQRFQGTPGAYSDNTGSIALRITQSR